MSAPNGHAQEDHAPVSSPPPAMLPPGVLQIPTERIKELVAALEVPFDSSQIEWRGMNTTKNQQPAGGQVVPYADQRAYTDRLNTLFTPAGWTRKYAIHTSANFERSKDQKIAAKVLVTCELTIFGLGSHSATGEEWADDDNSCTAAEAQSFKRACSCFGLGRYLYYFTGTWVDLDEHKRPKAVPQIAGWATPAGWRQGLRPRSVSEPENLGQALDGSKEHKNEGTAAIIDDLREIENMEKIVGKRMYRGILKSVARVWNPRDIRDGTVLHRALSQMQAAQRGLLRATAARDKAGLAKFARVLGATRVSSLDQVDSLKRLHDIVIALEEVTARGE